MKGKVKFTLRIGLVGCVQEDEFTLDELGYDPKYHADLEDFLDAEWSEWAYNYTDGGWRMEGGKTND
ncbi:hypothetical protein [Siminovitchia sp. FSL W7-1587]|uniref:DUF7167 family protein n=1 Tax=Siminovitchia sp. FSL W7-1587 TaxID=2954699 RepID=UPI0030D5B59E